MSAILNKIDSFDSKVFLKRLIIVVIFIVILYLIFHFAKKEITDLFAKDKAKELDKQLDNEIQTEHLTYPESDYTLMASTLYTAMDGAGTDESAIGRIFNKMQNRSDVLKLIQAFGVKDGEDLSQWLQGDLDAADMATYVNDILSKKQINYSF